MTRWSARDLGRRLAPPAWLALSIVGAVALAWILVHPEGRGSDAFSYWYWDPRHPYQDAFGNVDAPVAFRYAPPIALMFLPFHALSFGAFLWLWTGVLLVALAWQARWWSLAAAAFYPVLLELSVANVHLLLAAAIVAGFRWPEAWAFPLLTKVTPGIGLLWFAVRREWHLLGRAVGLTLLVVAATALLVPSWWSDWLAMLRSDIGLEGGRSVPVPLLVRLPAAAAVVVVGARRDWRWAVPLGAFMALPTIWPHSFAMLVAIVPLAGLADYRPVWLGQLALRRIASTKDGQRGPAA